MQLAQDLTKSASPQSWQLWQVFKKLVEGEVLPPSDTVMTVMESEPWQPPPGFSPGSGSQPSIADSPGSSQGNPPDSQISKALGLLKLLGVEVPEAAKTLLEKEEDTERATRHQQLMLEANYGVAAPRALPAEDVLKKMATASRTGHWICLLYTSPSPRDRG